MRPVRSVAHYDEVARRRAAGGMGLWHLRGHACRRDRAWSQAQGPRQAETHRHSVAKLRSELFDSVESEMQKATKKVESEMQKATKEMQEHLTEEVRQGVERLVQSTHDSMTTTVMQPNTIHDAASRAKLVHIREISSHEHMVATEQQQRGVSMGAMLRKVQARTISVLRDFGEVGAPL